jgi:hypothetical protein
MTAWIIVVLLAVLLTFSTAFAGGKGKGAGGQMGATRAGAHSNWNAGLPPGSDQGQKKGWQGGTSPRGWSNDKGQKQGWGGEAAPKGIGKKQMQ